MPNLAATLATSCEIMLSNREAWQPVPIASYAWEIDFDLLRSNADDTRRKEAHQRIGAYIAHVTRVEAENDSRLMTLVETALSAVNAGLMGADELGQAGAQLLQWMRLDWGLRYDGENNRRAIERWACHETRRFDLLPSHVREARVKRVCDEGAAELRTIFGHERPVMVPGTRYRAPQHQEVNP